MLICLFWKVLKDQKRAFQNALIVSTTLVLLEWSSRNMLAFGLSQN